MPIYARVILREPVPEVRFNEISFGTVSLSVRLRHPTVIEILTAFCASEMGLKKCLPAGGPAWRFRPWKFSAWVTTSSHKDGSNYEHGEDLKSEHSSQWNRYLKFEASNASRAQ